MVKPQALLERVYMVDLGTTHYTLLSNNSNCHQKKIIQRPVAFPIGIVNIYI